MERPSASASRGRAGRWAIVVLGVVALQCVLFGPSLLGQRVLLPLDILAAPGVYLPASSVDGPVRIHNGTLSDQVFAFQLGREFTSRELREGRLPLWSPYGFAGAPFAKFAKYSPINLLYALLPAPITLAWMQLVKSLIAGLGAYAFFRRSLRVSFFSATIGAWAYPISGFYMLWQGYEISYATPWLPWLLLAVDELIVRGRAWAGPAAAALVALTLVSGQLDVAAQVLLAAGLYAAFRSVESLRESRDRAKSLGSVAAFGAACLLGLALASPYWLPLVEYGATSQRMDRRARGEEERPPAGPSALGEVLVPEAYGSFERGSMRVAAGNPIEGAPAAYAGLLAALLLAPLGLVDRSGRRDAYALAVLGVLGMAWVAGIPGFVQLLRAPPFNLLSHNRFVFLTGFALIALTVRGLDAVRSGVPGAARRWLMPFVVLAVACLAWTFHGSLDPPVSIESLRQGVTVDGRFVGRPGEALAGRITASFVRTYWLASMLSVAVVALWAALLWGRVDERGREWLARIAAVILLAELLWFGHGLNPQTDPALYYPRLPVLAALAEQPPGRIVGAGVLPARLGETHELRDVRGYDGVDPARYVDLLEIAAAPEHAPQAYAYSQLYRPRIELPESGGVRLSPVLDLLGLRYVVFRGEPPEGRQPLLRGGDYYVLENERALPRVFVPRRVETLRDASARLRRMAAPDFDPRAIAFVEESLELTAPMSGRIEIVRELPRELDIEVDLERRSLVVIADLWDAGWRATVDGSEARVWRVDHALRGVVVPAGRHLIAYRFTPSSLPYAVAAMTVAAASLLIWLCWGRRLRSGAHGIG